MDERIAKIEKQVDVVLNNHLPHLSDSIQKLHVSIAEIAVNVSWLLKFFWIIAGASITSLAAIVFSYWKN